MLQIVAEPYPNSHWELGPFREGSRSSSDHQQTPFFLSSKDLCFLGFHRVIDNESPHRQRGQSKPILDYDFVQLDGRNSGIRVHNPFTPSDVPEENRINYSHLKQRAEAPGSPDQPQNLGQIETSYARL